MSERTDSKKATSRIKMKIATSYTRRLRLACALIGVLALLGASSAQAEPMLKLATATVRAQEEDLSPATEAGAQPWELGTVIKFGTTLDPRVNEEVPSASVKTVEVELPPGQVGNPNAMPQCSQADFLTFQCPVSTQIGYAVPDLGAFVGHGPSVDPLYNLKPPAGIPAQFGFQTIITDTKINLKVRTGGDYGVTAVAERSSGATTVYGFEVHVWGVPSAASHDALRFLTMSSPSPGDAEGKPLSNHLAPSSFLRTPTSCEGPTAFNLRAFSWQEPAVPVSASSSSPGNKGCASLPFAPTVRVTTASHRAAEPAPLTVALHLPQNEEPGQQQASDVKKVQMRFPAGVAINPSGANGLAACSDEQFGLHSPSPDQCPAASRIGEVEVGTPLLSAPLTGALYLGAPLGQGPQAAAEGKMYRVLLAAQGSGVWVKREGTVVPDPMEGRLTVTFDEVPQLPFEDLTVAITGGPQASLSLPKQCGTYKVVTELTPWARPSEPVTINSNFSINEGCDGAGKFEPSISAGTASSSAGAFAPFALRVTEPNGQQNLSALEATLPKGLLAKLKGVAVCADAEAATGNCPPASQIGTTTVGAGLGPSPVYIPQPGKPGTAVYLAGPYKGAPYSLVVKVPAQAGPFDLGTVTVRNALRIDPTTTQVTAVSDPLPQILLGVPISYRDVRVEINGPNFTVNPTNCMQQQVTSNLSSIGGMTATPGVPFAVANCGELPFGPSLALQFKGQTRRAGNPALSATLKAPAGQANIAKTTVLLPKTQFVDNRHINNPCTRVQFNAAACPPKSILGQAVAYSPLLDQPLKGPVYFRSNGGERELPDLVADLDGQIHVTLVGFIDSVPIKGTESARIRTRFLGIPDAPVSKFELKLYGGKKGLIQNSTNLCKGLGKAKVQMAGQNGKPNDFDQKIATSCGGKSKKTAGGRK
jgi:hypothetical protein